MDPRTRLVLLGCVGVLALLLDSPLVLMALALLCALPLLGSQITPAWRWRAVGIVLAVVWSTVLSQGLFYAELPRIPLVRLGPVVVYQEGVVHGFVQSMRLVAVSLAGISLAVTTSPDRLFAGLISLRVNYALAFLAVTALRFVPVAATELLIVRSARARRGRPITARSPWAWLRLEISMLVPVVARSLRRARVLAETLDARGFDPLTPRTMRKPLVFAAWEWPVMGAAVSVVLCVATTRGLYWLYVAEVLYIPGLRPMYGMVRTWL